ncbi:MAG: transposase [Actinomycetota bacterium]|nr:transposase [Actinomycetota bacterium]
MTLFRDPLDFDAFLHILERTFRQFGWRCYAFSLMPNHYHLLIETPEPNRGKGMRHLNGSYAQRFNTRYDGSGHVFQGPYLAVPLERESHLLEVCRYIVLNPVRAGICRRPGDWPWSSYRPTAGLAPPTGLVSAGDVLALFHSDDGRAKAAYRAFVAAGMSVAAASPDRVPGARRPQRGA